MKRLTIRVGNELTHDTALFVSSYNISVYNQLNYLSTILILHRSANLFHKLFSSAGVCRPPWRHYPHTTSQCYTTVVFIVKKNDCRWQWSSENVV